MSDGSASDRRMELRKYPNRRYYDTTQSQYVTLAGIYSAIRDGYDVHVTDSKTGEDITTTVLAQIILEQDAPKLDIFPVALLHQLIRTNDTLIRDFVDKYFCRALSAFLESRRHFEQYLRQTMGLQTGMPAPQDWARMMMGPFAPAFFPGGPPGRYADNRVPPEKEPANAGDDRPGPSDVRDQLEQLRLQVESLRKQM
jgi:polyhydroxyalkanoate synthesis repressor PhaR